MLVSLHRLAFPALALLSLYTPTPVNGAVVTLLYISEIVTPTPTPTGTRIAINPVSWEESETIIASEIGLGDAGVTRYEFKQIASKLVLYKASTTVTYISEPTTRTWTEEHGVSMIHASLPATLIKPANFVDGEISLPGSDEHCTIDRASGTGECVQNVEKIFLGRPDDVNAEPTSTLTRQSTRTYSGTLVPYATVTTNSGMELGPKTTLMLGSMLMYTLMAVV